MVDDDAGNAMTEAIFAFESLDLGASAVLEYTDGRRGYWALVHAGDKPDFHLRKSFVLRL